LFRDPLAALVEKEVRFLSRAPRFRLLFIMGFSFGLLIWLPMTLRTGPESAMRGNYLTIVSAYALLLLGEVCFWNSFGMDRTAAQTYFVMPVRISTVLVAKNIAAAFFITLDVMLVALFCLVLGMPITLQHVGEAFAVTTVLAVMLLGIGNMLSTRYPKPINPAQSWRAGSMGKVQAFLLFVYPVASIPVFLAYGARYAFDSELAFYGVILVDLLIAAVVYHIAMESASASAMESREMIIDALSKNEGPVG
jgi:ABC-2 type transport system permease protein